MSKNSDLSPAAAPYRVLPPRDSIESGQTKRDLTVSSFMLALVLVGVIVAAHTDRPVFWLLIGPTPFVVLHTTRTFLRRRLIRREGLLTLGERDR